MNTQHSLSIRATLVTALRIALLLAISLPLLAFYTIPSLQYYKLFWLQNFDFGILFESTQKIWNGQPLFLTTRGVHAWADNQDYFQLFLAPLHAVKDSREALLLVHSLALFAPGFLVLLLLRKMPFQAIGASLFVWLSPFLINANLDLIHTESFATVFLIGVYACAKRGHVLGFILCSLSALSCKEDVAFTYAMLMLLIYWKHNDFKISRSVALFGCITAICIFLTNFFWVLPNFKLATCQWLNPTFSIDRLDYAPTAPFFRTFFTDIQTAAFYQRMLGRPELGLYLLKLCWPLLLLGRAAWPFALAIIPGVALNTISNTGYYIEAYYHYDHSTFAAVIIALLWALPRAKLPRTRAILIGSTAVVLHLALPSWFRMHVTEMPQASWWVKATHPAVTTLELLREKLPSGLVISADYNSLNYLLNPAQTVFMYENPIRRHYFGIYFVCEDLAAPPPVDLVIIRQSYDVKPEMDLLLSRDYREFSFQPAELRAFVNQQGTRHQELEGLLEALGATPLHPASNTPAIPPVPGLGLL